MNAYWDKYEGRDGDGDKFVLHPFIDKDTGRILATVSSPAFPDGFIHNAFFDSEVPNNILNTDGSFLFISLESAKKFIEKTLQRAEQYTESLKTLSKAMG